MSHMVQHPTNDRRPDRYPHRVDAANTRAAERPPYERHFESLVLPELISVPKLPAWVRRLRSRNRRSALTRAKRP